ncbi:cysteine proteinase [Microthyrium microscopicum]|uniref:Ubiquitin carboxyl-terminal hydrolase n=1 Tax=Microthyrium microscopicum TaxID=703497 RepID=A0A6A6UQG5_9PEZI|nr:cysteine proteinase [Microthyrium microscopicum]
MSQREPFYPKLPWYSVDEHDYPARARRRRRRARQQSPGNLTLPEWSASDAVEQHSADISGNKQKTQQQPIADKEFAYPDHEATPSSIDSMRSDLSAVSDQRIPDTPTTATSTPKTTPKAHVRPAIPAIPKISPAHTHKAQVSRVEDEPLKTLEVEVASNEEASPQVSGEQPAAEPAKPAAPKSWADLVRTKGPANVAPQPNSNGADVDSTPAQSKSTSLAEAIRAYNVRSAEKLSFLEPRGLVNTGNMCYMNSILQVLVSCIPFYDFLEQVGKKAAHSFKSETPLLDAMILFMREYKVIDSAESVEKLRMRLKDTELEQYGDAFIPEYVYDAIKRLPRFSTMRRGHQQDAEEFMGFLLEGLHDECASVLRHLPSSDADTPTSPISERSQSTEAGWLEVGPKQRSAVTRSSGFLNTDSPITKIFGGKIRSELRVPGLKNSVTMEPYQALQLDIGASTVQNIVDALKNLTRPETLHGDFASPRGPGTNATKQIFIDSLPPVLILHLKRFQYDNTGGVQKIWKKVGYPLELTMPKEVFSTSRRNAISLSGMPKYRLSAVVYHHGKNASGGHYTVDIRRQDGIEWVRLDDTVIRRLRAEDVASAGADEDPKVLAKALEEHKRSQSSLQGQNMFESFGNTEENQDDEEGSGWNQVNGSSSKEATPSGRKLAAVANGATTPSTGKLTPKPDWTKDSKVAYILFYRKIE